MGHAPEFPGVLLPPDRGHATLVGLVAASLLPANPGERPATAEVGGLQGLGLSAP
jgi:hypothetical protein